MCIVKLTRKTFFFATFLVVNVSERKISNTDLLEIRKICQVSNCWFLAWGMTRGLVLLISTVDLFVRDQQALKSYVNLLRLMVWRYLVLKVLTHSFPMHSFSSPWKHQKTVKFSDVFRGKRKGALGMNEFIDRKSLLILGTLLKLVRFKTTKCLSSTVPHMKFYTFPVGPDLVRINNKKTVNVARVIKIND